MYNHILRPPSNLEEEIESAEVLDSLEADMSSIQDKEIKVQGHTTVLLLEVIFFWDFLKKF